MDEGSYFVCKLPRRVKTITEAFKSLCPDHLWDKDKGAPRDGVWRQGEWFFIGAPSIKPPTNFASMNDVPLRRRTLERTPAQPKDYPVGNGHYCTEVRYDPKRKDRTVYVRGFVRHSQGRRAHKNINLGQHWHLAFHNLAVRSWSSMATGGVD